MLDRISTEAVLQAITELRQWAAELEQVARTMSDFAFKWAERNGGVPKTKAASDKLLADYLVRFAPQPAVSDEQAMQAIEESYAEWAKERGIETATPADMQRFDDETGLWTRRLDELSGFTGPKDLCHRIGARLDELSRAAIAMGCDDATVAALKGVAELVPDIAEGRAVLSNPETWTQARLQANAVFQSESIAGIPLHRAWEVGLDRLEQAARSKAAAHAKSSPKGVTHDAEGRPDEPPISERQQNVLLAMLELQAFSSDSRKSTPEIAAKAEGGQADPEGFKEAVADLRKKNLLVTKEGRGGGCWLTDSGHERAEKLLKL